MSWRWAAAIMLGALAVGAVAAGWTELAISTPLTDIPGGQVFFFTLAAIGAPILAMAMLRRHPQESTGVLLAAAVLASMLGVCRTTPLGAFTPIAGLTALVLPLLPLLAVVNYVPLQSPGALVRTISICFWATAGMGSAIAIILLRDGSVPGTLWWTPRPGRPSSTIVVLLAGQTLVVVAASAAAVVGYLRLSLPFNGRLALRPIVVPTLLLSIAAAASAVWTLTETVAHPIQTDIEGDQSTTFLVLPTVLVGVLAAGIGWIDLAVRRSKSLSWAHTDVERYLAKALADPTIRVMYPVGANPAPALQTGFVTALGHPATPDLDDPERALTVIRRGQTLVGLIEQDTASLARPDAVELVATGAGLMMETERMTATAARDLEQSRLLAARLLSAADEPRATLRAQLLAGPLAELDAISVDLAAGESLHDVCDRLSEVTAQVRQLSHGVFPAALRAGGLRAVLSATEVPVRRYSPVTEMTAYLAAYHDPSAGIVDAFSGDGAALQIFSTRAPSAELLDRVTALGGRVTCGPASSDHVNHGAGDHEWTITVPDSSD